MRMQWRHLMFMHWPIAAEKLRSLIPDSLAIDEFDGMAWVGLVPFTMRDVLPAIVPRLPVVSDIPRLSAFHECNVRTYVTPRRGDRLPGVWFFSLDAQSRAGVWGARRFFQLPYFYARIRLDRKGDTVRYSVDRRDQPRASMRCQWTAGKSLPPSQPGELSYFLTERYALYSIDSRGGLVRCRIWHRPWPLRDACLQSLTDELVCAAKVEVDRSRPPLLHHADELDVSVWKIERL
jgi:uncharacterized protein YqjF (DUF2071 family)